MFELIFILPVIVLLLFISILLFRRISLQDSLLFVLALLPLMDLKVTKEAWGGFKTFDVICVLCFIFFFKDFTTINLKNENKLYTPLFVLLCIIIILGGLSSETPDRTYISLLKIFPIFIFCRFLTLEGLRDPSFHFKIIKALKFSFLMALTFLFLQTLIGLKFTYYPELGPNTSDSVLNLIRYPGVFYDSQAHGQYLALGSFLFLYVEDGAKKSVRIVNYLIFTLAIIAIIIAGSRAAFGGFILGLIFVFFIAFKRYRILGIALIIVGTIIYTVASPPRAGVFERASSLSEDYLFRQSIWKEAFEISKKHPYLGIGSGNYQSYVTRHNQDQYLELESGKYVYFDQPENGYLKIMVELGFTGFAIFLLFLILPLFKGLHFHLRKITDNRITFFMASLISWMIAFNTVYSIYDSRILIMAGSMIVLILVYPSKDYFSNEEV